WSIISGDKLIPVKLRFSAQVTLRVKETRWHPSQDFLDDPDDPEGCIWTAQIADLTDFRPWVRGWGADVEVLEPKPLRWAMRAESRRLARMYGVKTNDESSPQKRVLRCWGKTVKGSSDFHPAVFHMLNVGHVAREFLDERASPRWRRVLARALGAEAKSLIDWLPYLVALHDIGKISAAFQMSDRKQQQKARLKTEGFSFGKWRPSFKLHHKDVGQFFVTQRADLALPPLLQRAWRETVAGHHGQFAAVGSLKQARDKLGLYEPPEWAELREIADQMLRGHFLHQPPAPWPEPANTSTAIMALTGFTILCDWLGSDGQYFPAQSEADLEEYAPESARLAREAMETAGFFQPIQSTAATSFAALFPDKTPPRPLQNVIDDVPAQLLSGPCLAIIEAPTGEGKTEAALALAHRLAQASGSDELYCALPTTATSNQMFIRLQEYLHEQLGLPTQVQLIHGQAFLIKDDLQPNFLSNGGQDDEMAAPEWFAPKKRALLAPFGVGTIDQAELAALNVKHNALRMIGLAGKVVIVDEVHAYDVYMTTIVECLLRWLSALGTSVILLSATLPNARRTALARAYSGDAELTIPDQEAYPSLWVVSQTGSHHDDPDAHQKKRTLQVNTLRMGDDEAQTKARWLLKAVADGGCACWISNTVTRSQEMFEAVKELAPKEVDCMLLHARFPLEGRQEWETELAKKYGPQGKRPPNGGIVIGTQVLEQSLDLDFDVMVSDLAPIDLLLQRAGRLHRHAHHDPLRPSRHKVPRLWINAVLDADGEPKLDVDRHIYSEYVLRQSWQTLLGKQEITLPGDYRPLIEAVYDQAAPPPDSPLSGAWKKLQNQGADAEAEANQRLLRDPDPESLFCAGTQLTFEEDEDSAAWVVAQTRLGRESVTVIPLERDGDQAHLFPTDVTVNLNTAAPRRVQLQLLRRSLRLSNYHVVQSLKAGKDARPPLFTGSALLKGCSPLWLTDGRLHIPLPKGILVLTLDPQLGLVMRQEGE
ncbi:MAG: CRISPR-associated helicase Cas3', partial [Anaerolineae bacterium]